jgi:hypothetical protein
MQEWAYSSYQLWDEKPRSGIFNQHSIQKQRLFRFMSNTGLEYSSCFRESADQISVDMP